MSLILSRSTPTLSPSPSLFSAPSSSADPEARISLAMQQILASTLSEDMTSLPSAYKFTVVSGSPPPTMPSHLKVFGQYLIKVSRKYLREVNVRQKGDMSSVLTPIAFNKGRIMSDKNLMSLFTAYHRCSTTFPSFS